MAYFVKIEYYATGEGLRSYYILSSSKEKETVLSECLTNGIDPYFLLGAEFHELPNVPEKHMEDIKRIVPKMYNIIHNKTYEKGWIWIRYEDYYNYS